MALQTFLILLGLLFVLLGSSIWVGITLFIIGFVGIEAFTMISAGTVLGNVVWNQVASPGMLPLPLFIFMGEILVRTSISKNLFKGLAPFVNNLPGRLFHVNTIACAFFAAVSGSVAATTATVGKITIPEFKKRGYDESMNIGSIAVAGTLGIMIPPSMPMLIYGLISSVSIGQLFIAGVAPGLILAVLFSSYIAIRCIIKPPLAPSIGEVFTWKDKMVGVPKLLPVFLLILFVLGSIYTGFATPTEAAAVGVLGAILFAVYSKDLTKKIFTESLIGAVNTTCMIVLITTAAGYFSVAVGYCGIPRALSKFIVDSNVSPYLLIFIISLFYIILGCLVDGFSMIVMSVPIILPLIVAAGFDPLWFGIYLVVMVQVAQVTPPVGFNLFVLNGITEHDVIYIAKASFPFFIIMMIFTIFLIKFPIIALYLPRLMIQ